MNITLYKNDSDNRVVQKSLSGALTIENVFLKETVNLINPTFVLEGTSDVLKNYNYLYAPDFDRYYYITGITIISANQYQVDCEIDVLMSFADDIKNAVVNVSRAGGYVNPLIRDTKIKNSTQGITVIRKLTGHEFLPLITSLNNSIVLETLGG